MGLESLLRRESASGAMSAVTHEQLDRWLSGQMDKTDQVEP